EQVPMKAGTVLTFPDRSDITREYVAGRSSIVKIPPGSTYHFGPDAGQSMVFHEGFNLAIPPGAPFKSDPTAKGFELPPETRRLVPGSSWGTFTIACTIPIALFVGWYMYRLRKGKILEASLLGAAAVLAATFAGALIPGSRLEPFFLLSRNGTIAAIAVYVFVASVLPVWLLLAPPAYLSTFLHI